MRCPCLLLSLLLFPHVLLVESFLRAPYHQQPYLSYLSAGNPARVLFSQLEIPVVISQPPPLPPLPPSSPEKDVLKPPPLPAATAPAPAPVPAPKATKIKNAVLFPPSTPHILRVHHDENVLPTHPNETHVIIRRMSLKYVSPLDLGGMGGSLYEFLPNPSTMLRGKFCQDRFLGGMR
jgi:hypothetical protein